MYSNEYKKGENEMKKNCKEIFISTKLYEKIENENRVIKFRRSLKNEI